MARNKNATPGQDSPLDEAAAELHAQEQPEVSEMPDPEDGPQDAQPTQDDYFSIWHQSLDEAAAELHAQVAGLVRKIQESGKFYPNFRRLKNTLFMLERLGRRNRLPKPEREKREGKKGETFKRLTVEATSLPAPRVKRDIFKRPNRPEQPDAEPAPKKPVKNIFARPKFSGTQGRVQSTPAPPEDHPRKILATSESED
jgi:hypothetical protein